MKTIVITGGHSGIGLELSKLLLAEKYQIIWIVRHPKRLEQLPKTLTTASNLEVFFADLSDRGALNEVAASILKQYPKIDYLFNNAGVLLDQAYYSKQGYEMHLEVNALAPYYLSLALAPALNQAATPIIINTTTSNLQKKTSLDLAELQYPTKFKKLFGSYMESKFVGVLLMDELILQQPTWKILQVDPGPNKTPMTKGNGMPKPVLWLRNLVFPQPTSGAAKLYKAAMHHQTYTSGSYISWGKTHPINYKLSPTELQSLLQPVATLPAKTT